MFIFGQLQFDVFEHVCKVISSKGGKILFIGKNINIVLLKFKDSFLILDSFFKIVFYHFITLLKFNSVFCLRLSQSVPENKKTCIIHTYNYFSINIQIT